MEKIGCGMAMANTWTDPPMVLLYAFVAFFASWVVLPALSYVCFVAYGPYGLAAGPAVIGVLYLYYQFVWLNTPAADCEEHLIFTDEACKKTWGKKKIPIHIFVSEFLDDKIRFKKDCLDTLWAHRDEFIDWRPSWNLFWFLLYQLLPSRGDTLEGYSSSSQKDVASTTKEIAEHYDRGNDFFAAFLGARRRRRPRNSGGAQFGRRQRPSSGAQFGLSAVHSLRLTSAAAAPPCAQARR